MNKLFSRCVLAGAALALVTSAMGCGQPLPEDNDAEGMAMLTPEGIVFQGKIPLEGITEQALSGVLLDTWNKINAARGVARKCGTAAKPKAAALTQDDRLSRAAQGHSEWMASTLMFTHTETAAGMVQPWDRVTKQGYSWSTVGENIAAGYATADAAVAGWLASPGHCENIMNPAFNQAGLGMKYTASGPYHYYWTMVFAHPL